MVSKGKPRIVLADDNPLILQRASLLLQDKYEIAATASDGAEAIRAVHEVNPIIVVLDIAMPVMNGLQAARHLRNLSQPCGIVFLSVQEDLDYIEAACELQASYVVKKRMNSDLPIAAEECLAGRMFVSPVTARSERQSSLPAI
jgi:DNA-binding NarL/FixJ family response regulator